jgi:hypothetical protein
LKALVTGLFLNCKDISSITINDGWEDILLAGGKGMAYKLLRLEDI